MTSSADAGTAVDEQEQSWQLRLYVAGQSPKSLRAFVNLKRLCETHLPGRSEIEVVDLVEHPSLARSEDIVAVPTLVVQCPLPMRRVIGDLSNTSRVVGALGLASELAA